MFTRLSITGTSTNTPTTVANATGEEVPKSEIATATDNSKKLDAPIIPAGAAISCGNLKRWDAKYPMKKIRYVWIVSGMAIRIMCSGFFRIMPPWKAKIIISVSNKPPIVTFLNLGRKT